MTLFVLLLRGKNVVNVVNDDIFCFLKKEIIFFFIFQQKVYVVWRGCCKKKKENYRIAYNIFVRTFNGVMCIQHYNVFII